MIFTEDKIQRALDMIRTLGAAREVSEKIFDSADQWTSWDDHDLMNLIPDADVPRSFDLNAQGCPEHGDAIFKGRGFYPWLLDPRRPFEVRCPIGMEIYPSNDFNKYYTSGYKQREDWDSDYVDIGWGWVSPAGDRYWFVAYANHWILRNFVHPAIRDLGRAYILSGNSEYAHKATVLLYRLAEVYPAMNYSDQSRYGLKVKADNRKYTGKVFNRIWETGFIKDVAECYDAIWPYVDQDRSLHGLLDAEGPEIRRFIEERLLEEAIQAYKNKKLDGNYGMHQMALLYLMKARQYVDTAYWVDRLLNRTGMNYQHTGINYALYNFILQDGIPFESPFYNFLWIQKLTQLGQEMKSFNVNLFEKDRMKSMLKGPLRMSVDNRFTVDVGDSGSTLGGVIGRDPETYKIAYMNYKDISFLKWIYGDFEDQSEVNDPVYEFESLFLPDYSHIDLSRGDSEIKTSSISNDGPQPGSKVGVKPDSSRLFSGYGTAILSSENEANTIALTYGMHGAHYHWDFLNFELFANGQKMMPDLGYPDAMNSYVPGVYTWSQNTASHNTVVIDSKKQDKNKPGGIHDFSAGFFARTVDASSPAYEEASHYRRHLTMVDVGENQSYVVDVFRVKGGKRHDYLLHGPPGQSTIREEEWGEILPGTYAGPEVEWGELYDDAELGHPDYNGGYHRYGGSGFQYLENVRELKTGEGMVDFQHLLDPKAGLRIRILGDERQKMILTEAYDKPRARDHRLKYLIAKAESETDTDTLSSTFISVLEPYSTQPFISSVSQLETSGETAVAVLIDRGGERDVVLSDTISTPVSVPSFGIDTDATTALITFNKEESLRRVFFSGGSYLQMGNQRWEARNLTGLITKIDFENNEVHILPDNKMDSASLMELNTRMLFVRNGKRKTVQPVESIHFSGERLIANLSDDVFLGRIHTERIPGSNDLKSHNTLFFEEKFPGAVVLNDDFHAIGRVKTVRKKMGRAILEIDGFNSLFETFGLQKQEDVWISNVGVGDKVEMHSLMSWEAE